MEARWRNVNEVVVEITDPLDEVARRGAEDMAVEMRSRVKQRSGTLSREIDVEVSKFKGGGYLVIAQGSNNYIKYYASFLEFGTDKMDEKGVSYHPFMRPAIKKFRPIIQRKWQEALDE